MKKFLCIVFMIMVFFMIQMSPASAWNVVTHYEIAEQTYYSLPVHVQQKLNLGEMEDGAAAPDLIFRDYRYHHYPSSLSKIDLAISDFTQAIKLNPQYAEAYYARGNVYFSKTMFDKMNHTYSNFSEAFLGQMW